MKRRMTQILTPFSRLEGLHILRSITNNGKAKIVVINPQLVRPRDRPQIQLILDTKEEP